MPLPDNQLAAKVTHRIQEVSKQKISSLKSTQPTENNSSAPEIESHESHLNPFETHANGTFNPRKWLSQPPYPIWH
jgi:hypothetical protein